MSICVVGAGYVGLTTAAVLADLGHAVYCTDQDVLKIEKLNQGIVPIYEPGLDEMIQKNRKRNRLFFRSDVSACMANHEIIMIAVGTPSAGDGSADLSYVNNVLMMLSQVLEQHKTIVIKSTVPPGTGYSAEALLLGQGVSADLFDIVSNPEFLREGTAIQDTLRPDRIVIGSRNAAAAMRVQELYQSIETEYLLTGCTEAELIKYGSNAFLATKISFVNELARVCEAFDADVTKVSLGIGMDQRIGSRFLQAGIGYGGSCLPKDVNALVGAAHSKGLRLELLQAAGQINATQLDIYLNKLERTIGNLDSSSTIAVWGATFKENTDDIRYSQAIALMEKLHGKGCDVTAYDPLVRPAIPGVVWSKSAYEAVYGADALIVATGWRELIQADWHMVKALMKGSVIMDGRNVIDKAAVEQAGLRYVGVGRP